METKEQLIEEINGCRRALTVYFDDSEYAVNALQRLIRAEIKLSNLLESKSQ